MVAANNKRQITVVFGITLSGDFLPPQLIYQETTPKCLSSIRFPTGWDVTFSENHWSNESTMEDYLNNIQHTATHSKLYGNSKQYGKQQKIANRMVCSNI